MRHLFGVVAGLVWMAFVWVGVAMMTAGAGVQAQPEPAKIIGTIEAEIDGAPTRFIAMSDPAHSQPDIMLGDVLGKVFFTITTTADGSADGAGPYLVLKLGPDGVPPVELSDVQLRDAGMILSANTETGASPKAEAVSYGEGGALDFHFSARLVEMRATSGDVLVPAADGQIRTISGRFRGTVPLE